MDSSEECCDDSAQSDELYTPGCESSFESGHTRKRKLALITASEKRDLCLWKREHPRSTLKEVALWGRINLNLDLAKSTVSRILQESDKWIDTPPEVADGTSSRSPHVADLEKSLVTWIHEARSRGVYVSDLMIVEKARSLGKYLKVREDFRFSRGWLHRFKTRHSVSYADSHSEKPNLDSCLEESSAELACTSRTRFQAVVADYSLNNIYIMQEMLLCYAASPGKNTAKEKRKHAAQRLMVGLLCNASGTHRWTPIVIGGARRPPSFGSLFDPDIYCSYHYEAGMCLTGDILTDTLRSLNENLCKEKRHAVILIDEARRCDLADLDLCNLKIELLPSQCASDVASMRECITHAVKALYRKDLVLHSSVCRDAELQSDITVRWALRALSDAWMSVPSQVISDACKQTGILPFQLSENPGSDAYECVVSELQEVLDRVYPEGVDAVAYVCVDDSVREDASLPAPREQPQRIASILEPDRIDAWRGLHTLITYLEQEGDVTTIRELTRIERGLSEKPF